MGRDEATTRYSVPYGTGFYHHRFFYPYLVPKGTIPNFIEIPKIVPIVKVFLELPLNEILKYFHFIQMITAEKTYFKPPP